MKTRHCMLVLLLLLAFNGCKKEEEERKLTNTFSITREIWGGFTGYSYSAKMDQSGLLQIIMNVSISSYYRESNYQIDTSDITLIREAVSNLSYINIKDSYGFDNIQTYDLPVTIITYKTDFNSDSTAIYLPKEGELPNELKTFWTIIDKIIMATDTLYTVSR